jgi:HTH-type transcriptional regulator/antitoxin HigA
LLIALIEKFEADHYPIPERTPLSTLLHLMEANEIERQDLLGVFSSLEIVNRVIEGERAIERGEAQALASYFQVDASLFASMV